LSVKFQVERSRVNELRGHLESQPEVICSPDRDAHFRPKPKPFATRPAAGSSAKRAAEPTPTPADQGTAGAPAVPAAALQP
jgi:hypothetical protein